MATDEQATHARLDGDGAAIVPEARDAEKHILPRIASAQIRR